MHTHPDPASIIGGPVSPYVRKVLAVCEMKAVPYRLDPIVPFFGDDRFSELSPLRRIPVYIDDQVTLCDSTVICEYLEERFATPSLLPPEPSARAQARWLEEYADTRLADVFIWRIFYQAVILPIVFGTPRDKAKIANTVAEEVPQVMAYLEKIAPVEGFLSGQVSIADLAVAVPFANLRWARVELDRRRWPNTLGWVERSSATPGLAGVTRLAERLISTPMPQHRAALAEMGAPLSKESWGSPTLRPSLMRS